MTERPTNTQPIKQHPVHASPDKHLPAAPSHAEKKEEKKPAEAPAIPITTPVKKDASTKKQVKKEEAIAIGRNLPISLKHSMYISTFIKQRSIDQAMNALEEVAALRRAVPFKGEIPHRSEPGMMSGRYPQSAAKEFIHVLKNLKGNAIANGLDLEKTKISYACPSWAARPMRRGGRKGKRVYLVVKAHEMSEEAKNHG